MSEEQRKEIVSKDKLLEAAVYFGHKKDKWNPKMKPYIATIKKGTHILDVDKTKRTLEFAYSLVRNFAKKGAKFVFVGTKKQAKVTIKENALRTNSFHVTERWLGGTLTNSRTIFQRVKRMEQLERLQAKSYEGYTKKEGLLLERELTKLQRNLNGIRAMRYRPNVMIVADMASDAIAIKEAKRLGVKVIALADSNDDPSFVDIAIPANNDSVKSLTLILTILADAIAEGKGGQQLWAYQGDAAIELPEELKKERKFPPRGNFRRNSNFRSSTRPSFRNSNPKPATAATSAKPATAATSAKPATATTTAKPTTTTTAKPVVKTEAPKKVEAKVVKPVVGAKPQGDLATKTVAELKDILKTQELSTSGLKAELIERLEGKK